MTVNVLRRFEGLANIKHAGFFINLQSDFMKQNEKVNRDMTFRKGEFVSKLVQ